MDINISDLVKYKGKSCSVVNIDSVGYDLYDIERRELITENVKKEQIEHFDSFKEFKIGDIVIQKEKREIYNLFYNFSDKLLIVNNKIEGSYISLLDENRNIIVYSKDELIRVIPFEYIGYHKLGQLLQENKMSNHLLPLSSPSNGQQRIKSILHEDMKQTRLVDRIREIQFNHQHDSVHDEYKQVLSAIDVFISKDSRTRFVYPKQLSMTIVKKLQRQGLTVTIDNKTTIISWS